MSGPLEAVRTIVTGDAWLVGGALRDRLLGRETADYDIAVRGDPKPLARALARRVGGHPFLLSEGFGAWRVVAHDHGWQVDLLPLAGDSIEDDLRKRDLTINAIAEPLRGGVYVDPLGGLADLSARRLRMVSARAFADDPLRTIRVARLACELGFGVDPQTSATARANAAGLAGVAVERTFAELKRIVIADGALIGLQLMDELGATDVVLPELARLHGVEQSPYHHLDVHDHTMSVLQEAISLAREPEAVFEDHALALRGLLAEPFANELNRGQALRFGALLHDIAKPQTRAVTPEGRVTFLGHDEAGAEVGAGVLARLRASERLCEHVAALTRQHLRLGFLVHQMPLDRRAVYRYLRACDPVAADVTLLSVADRLATRGRGSEEAIDRHLKLARQMLGEALAWREHPPRPPVRGDRLARAIGVEPGPEIGRLLDDLEEATFVGEIQTADEAIERARALLASSRAQTPPERKGISGTLY